MKTLALLCFGLVALAAPSQTTLQPADLAANAFFGFSISADGNLLAVGAPQFRTNTNINPGSVYIFQRAGGGTWVQQAKLQSPTPMFTDQFGMSVALQGNTLLVGAPKSNTTGRVFEFRLANGAWQHQATLLPEPNDILFGATLAFHRNALAIGSGAINTSSVYTVTRNQSTWSAPSRIQLANVLSFGGALAIQDDTMVIGAPHSNAAFIYTRSNGVWSQTTALAPVNNSLYGWSVAINNGRIAIGAPLGNQGGAAYVYRQVNGNWSPSFRLDALSAGGFGGENFAQGVALSATTLAVGAPSARWFATYTLNADTWTPLARQDNATGSFQALYGQNIALPDNNTTIVASPGWSSETEQLKGAVYITQK
jgi:hypothetical protein